jgi:hypothetical protein
MLTSSHLDAYYSLELQLVGERFIDLEEVGIRVCAFP